jgi:hypothetical protein
MVSKSLPEHSSAVRRPGVSSDEHPQASPITDPYKYASRHSSVRVICLRKRYSKFSPVMALLSLITHLSKSIGGLVYAFVLMIRTSSVSRRTRY